MPIRPRDVVLDVAVPLAGTLGCIAVALWYIAPGVDLDGMTRGIAGPGTWPKVMLYGAAICAALIAVRNAVALARKAAVSAPAPPPGEVPAEGEYDDIRLGIGIALIAGYGAGMGFVGMPLATMVFVSGWLVLGNLRRPLTIVLVSALGTAAILYLFVKVSLMPLERGKGVFEQITITLYRVLGIY